MKRFIIGAALLAPIAAFGQSAPAADPTVQALAATVQDLTQAWVGDRAQLIAARARVAALEAENKALKEKSTQVPAP